jgi:Domain of unknown function (DUF4440)
MRQTGETEMNAVEGTPTTPPRGDELKLYEAYADGKMKRYTLLFAVNGGAFAIAQAYQETGLLGKLTVPKLAVGVIGFSWIMLWDIWSFGEMMRTRYAALWKKAENDPTRLEVFDKEGRAILLLLVGLVTVAWVLAAIDAGRTRTRGSGRDEIVLAELQQVLARAWMSGDRATIERILAPEWSSTGPDGRVTNRARVLADVFETGLHKIRHVEIDDVRVQVHGDAAVVTGRTHGVGDVAGTTYDVVIRFTDTFVRRRGQWQAVASHASLQAR